MAGLVRIHKLHCAWPQGGSGEDEILMRTGNGAQIWPRRGTFGMNRGHTAEMRLDVPISDGQVEIQVWEIDDIGADDLLGKFKISDSEGRGPHTWFFDHDGRYELTFEVFRLV